MRLLRTLACLLAATAGLGLAAANTITASLTASPTTFSGKCPAVITFKGTITVTEPCKLQYKFIRSDGANAPVQNLEFTKAGTQPVSTTWTLGGPTLPTFKGWQAIEVVYPQKVTSNKAEFSVTCVDAKPEVKATLKANPPEFTGKCPAVIAFEGQITVTAPCKVEYKFLRSDGANAPVQVLDFPQAGTKPVHTTWTLGGPTLPTYTGWQAIEILAPVKAVSNRAPFKVTCVDGQTKKPDVGMYGFLKIGKKQKEVKWNETIVLGPEDATLVSNGKPAFEVYYSHREYAGVAVPGPFKNKIFFEGNLVSQQTSLSLAPSEIKPIHTQAYLGPKNGKLTIKIDADNEVAEGNEGNNEFSVNIQFRGF